MKLSIKSVKKIYPILFLLSMSCDRSDDSAKNTDPIGNQKDTHVDDRDKNLEPLEPEEPKEPKEPSAKDSKDPGELVLKGLEITGDFLGVHHNTLHNFSKDLEPLSPLDVNYQDEDGALVVKKAEPAPQALLNLTEDYLLIIQNKYSCYRGDLCPNGQKDFKASNSILNKKTGSIFALPGYHMVSQDARII